MEARLSAGSKINFLSPQEHDDILGKHLDRAVRDFFQEEARGYTTAPIIAIGTVDDDAITLPGAAANRVGPKQGFAWKVERLTVVGLASGDSITVSRDDEVIDTLTYDKATIYPGKGLICRGGQYLTFAGTSLTATGQITITGDAAEVAEPDIYKIL